MNDIPREKYDKAYQVAGYAGMAHKAMILYADSIRNDHEALDAASEAWHRNAVHYVHVARWFPWLVSNGVSYEPDVYLSYLLLGSLSRAKAERLEHEVNGGEMELWQVRERVDGLKQRKSKATKEPKVCKNCGAKL